MKEILFFEKKAYTFPVKEQIYLYRKLGKFWGNCGMMIFYVELMEKRELEYRIKKEVRKHE